MSDVAVKNDVVSKLKEIVGNSNVLTSASDMAKYLKGDEKPAAVVFPGKTEHVVAIVKAADAAGLKIAVAGRVVDTRGLKGGIALCMEHMSKILDIDHENLACEVEAGMLHKEFSEKMKAEKMFFPPEPYAVSTSSIAGCFAMGDVDSRAFNRLPTRTHILAYEMVLPSGEVMNVGSKCIKDVAGYDMIHFIAGSRGTLGIITKVMVKLVPLPVRAGAVVAELPSLDAAAKAFKAIQKRKIFPSRLNALNKTLGAGIQPTESCLVLVDIEGYAPSVAQYTLEVESELKIAGATKTEIITDEAAYNALWDKWLAVREKINTTRNKVRFTVGASNVVAAIGKLNEVVGAADACEGVLVEGLLGKITVLTPNAAQDGVKINKFALELGGNVSGLFGSRLRCEAYNDHVMLNEITTLINSIRNQFDPKGMLAPGIKF